MEKIKINQAKCKDHGTGVGISVYTNNRSIIKEVGCIHLDDKDEESGICKKGSKCSWLGKNYIDFSETSWSQKFMNKLFKI